MKKEGKYEKTNKQPGKTDPHIAHVGIRNSNFKITMISMLENYRKRCK